VSNAVGHFFEQIIRSLERMLSKKSCKSAHQQ
jgi:hypothetical protein